MEEETATIIFKRSPELQKGYLDPMVAADLKNRSGDGGPVALDEIASRRTDNMYLLRRSAACLYRFLRDLSTG